MLVMMVLIVAVFVAVFVVVMVVVVMRVGHRSSPGGASHCAPLSPLTEGG